MAQKVASNERINTRQKVASNERINARQKVASNEKTNCRQKVASNEMLTGRVVKELYVSVVVRSHCERHGRVGRDRVHASCARKGTNEG